MNKEKIKNIVLNMIYPRRCALCDRTISGNETVCSDCKKDIKLIQGNTCFKCGKKQNRGEDIYCYDCRKMLHSYKRGFSVFEYENIKKSIYKFKYSRRPEYARFYAKEAYGLLGDTIRRLNIQAFIPVPVHEKRLRERGYNQAEEFAKELSKYAKIPVLSGFVLREKYTNPLKRMEGRGRRQTLKNAFKLAGNDVKLSNICLVDDIYTTGATIDAISDVLKAYGIENIYFITIAIGKGL